MIADAGAEALSLAGKKALITGGTSGIGLATAMLFQDEGARVAVTGRSPANVDQARKVLGDAAVVLSSDAGSSTAISELVGDIERHFGKLDILFLNAAVGRAGTLEQVTESDFDVQIAVNLKGIFFLLQKAVPLLNVGASVIVTTSIANRFSSPGFSVYAATKAALRSLVQSMAVELIGRGIRVNAISPGPIDTPMYGRGGLPEEILKRKKASMQDRSPSKRFGTSQEVAEMALFLASAKSGYVVGQEIVVDGGMSVVRPF